MSDLIWFLLVTIVSTLTGMCWASLMVVIHCIVTLILSYIAAKVAAKPLLDEARKIRTMVSKALKGLGLGKDVFKQIAGSKGGSAKPDPVGSWIDEKLPGVRSFFGGGSGKASNNERLKQIVGEVKAKHGLVDRAAAEDGSTVPEVK